METITGYYLSPLGTLAINVTPEALISVNYHPDITENVITNPESAILQKTIQQLDEYFNEDRRVFDLPLKPEGTEFQMSVWNELLKIPYGETLSYAGLAERIGTENHSRAVGMANGKNPIAIIIPCHRVIGKSGDLTGYAGGVWRKQWLLEHENMQKRLF